MRSLILTLALLVLAVSLMLGGAFHLMRCCDKMLARLDTLPQKNDPASEVVEMQKYWVSQQWLLSAITPRSNVQRVEEQLLSLYLGIIEGHSYQDRSVQAECALLRYSLEQLKKDTLPWCSSN